MTFAKKIGKYPGPIGKTGKVLERGLLHSLGLPPGIKGKRDGKAIWGWSTRPAQAKAWLSNQAQQKSKTKNRKNRET